MIDSTDLVDELLSMAKEPDHFSPADMGEMMLIAATEIMKLREFGPPSTSFAGIRLKDNSPNDLRLSEKAAISNIRLNPNCSRHSMLTQRRVR